MSAGPVDLTITFLSPVEVSTKAHPFRVSSDVLADQRFLETLFPVFLYGPVSRFRRRELS